MRSACTFIAIAALALPAWSAPSITTRPVDESLSRALAFLAKEQNADGSFASDGPKVAVTGLALMSFLACGHTPDVGRYGNVLRAATDYLSKAVPEDGYVGRVDGSRMYGQGIVTLALAEA